MTPTTKIIKIFDELGIVTFVSTDRMQLKAVLQVTTAIKLATSNLSATTCNLQQEIAINVYYNCQKTCQLQQKRRVCASAELSVSEHAMERCRLSIVNF
jgi:hypothetical protein